MSFTDFKEVSISNPGTSTKYGSDDLLQVMQIFNGKVVATRQIRIKNPFQFIDHIEIKAAAALPASPTLATVRHIVVDPNDNHIKIQKTGGSMIDIDTLVANTWNAAASESLTNKTYQVDLNTLSHSTTNSLGELLVNTGTKWDRRAKGSALQILRVNAGGTDLEWVAPGVVSGGGEVNTVSNIGTGTVGVYKQKTGVNFELKTLVAGSANMSVIDDTANNRVKLDVNLSSIALNTLAGQIALGSQVSGTLPVSNGGTGASSLTGVLKGAGTGNITAIANGSNGTVLTMVSGIPSWSTLPSSSANNFMPDVLNWGGFWGGATSGSGVFAGADGYGASITGDQSNATDSYTTFTTDNSDAAIAGFKTLVTVTRRDKTPVLNIRFKVGNTSNSHVWMGYLSDSIVATDAGADDPTDGITGLLFGFSDVHNNFQVTYNAGGSGGAFIDTGIPKNTSIHDLQLEFDNVAGKVKATIDGAVKSPGSTADTPATNLPLFVHFNIEAVGSNAVPLTLSYAKLVTAH